MTPRSANRFTAPPGVCKPVTNDAQAPSRLLRCSCKVPAHRTRALSAPARPTRRPSGVPVRRPHDSSPPPRARRTVCDLPKMSQMPIRRVCEVEPPSLLRQKRRTALGTRHGQSSPEPIAGGVEATLCRGLRQHHPPRPDRHNRHPAGMPLMPGKAIVSGDTISSVSRQPRPLTENCVFRHI
jgi:hypothetical protein